MDNCLIILIEKAIQIYHESGYKTIIATGGKLPSGYYISGKTTMAEFIYATLLELGFDSAQIVVIPSGTIVKERPFPSGLSLENWFVEYGITNAKVGILAVGRHSRKTEFISKSIGR